MNDEPLHTWIEPELEARITALVLGEASDFEREELERLINERPELGAYRKRLETIHELLRSNAEGETEPEGEWKLSDERRATVLATLGQPRDAETDKAATDSSEGDEENAGEKVVRPSFWKHLSPTTLAACAALMLTAIVAFTVPAYVTMLNIASLKPEGTDAYVAHSDATAPDSERTWYTEAEVPQVIAEAQAVTPPVVEELKSLDLAKNDNTRDQVVRRSLALTDVEDQIDVNGRLAEAESAKARELTRFAGQQGASRQEPEGAASEEIIVAVSGGASSVPIQNTGSVRSSGEAIVGGRIELNPTSGRAPIDKLAATGPTLTSGGIISADPVTNRAALAGGPAPGGSEMELAENTQNFSSFYLQAAPQADQPVAEVEDKIPVVGDLPQVGRLFRSKSESQAKAGQSLIADKQSESGRFLMADSASDADIEALDQSDPFYAGVAISLSNKESTASAEPYAAPAPAPAMSPPRPQKPTPESGGFAGDAFADPLSQEMTDSITDVRNIEKLFDKKLSKLQDVNQELEALTKADQVAATRETRSRDLKEPIIELEKERSLIGQELAQVESKLNRDASGLNLNAKKEQLSRLSASLADDAEQSGNNATEMATALYFDNTASTTRAKMLADIAADWESQIPETEGEIDSRSTTITNAMEYRHLDSDEAIDGGVTLDGLTSDEDSRVRPRARYGTPLTGVANPDETGTITFGNGVTTVESMTDFAKVQRETAAHVDVDYIDINLAPEVVEFDGFINYGEEIKQAQNLRGFDFRKLRAEVPTALEEIDASDENFSTFSLHVGDVSFKLALAALAKGEWPDASRIRIEEFVNALTYDDLKPTQEEKVACQLEQATHPFLQQRNLLRVSMSTAALGRAAGTPLHLTFLLDNSGSMERIDRQETVRRAFAQLAGQLQPNDQVTLISFARQPRLLADQVSGDQAHQLVDTVSTLPSEGGTNLEAALNLAFEKATEQQAEGAQNRVILLTDGAANLGDAEPESLSAMIETMRDKGIAFDAAGIGADGLNDEILEALTRKGDGRYYLLDRPEDADDGFARQIAGALRPAAGNVKVQIEFNPDRVGKYKLLGFEKHRLEKEDFRDDSVDAAEMAAEESGVAVYQFEAKPDGEGDIGFASVRFRDMSSGEMVEKRWPILYEANAPRPDQAAPSMRIATAASQFAAHLKGDPAGAVVELGYLSSLLSDLPERYAENERVQQLKTMVEQARQISGQ